MRGHPRQTPPFRGPAAYRRTFEALDAALDRSTEDGCAERIRLLRRLYFADVDELAASGAVKLPPPADAAVHASPRNPRGLRDELNRRLANGEPGTRLVAWLNALPEVRALLARDFAGRPVSEQNLSEWKQGGFRDWLARQDALDQVRELAADAGELAAVAGGRLADHLGTVVTARYAAALAGWDGEATEDFRRRLRALRGLCQDIVELRRGDHSAARLQMERERLERDRERTEEEIVRHFKRWVEIPAMRNRVCQAWVSPEERERRLRELLGQEPAAAADAAAPGPADPESDPIKPNQTG